MWICPTSVTNPSCTPHGAVVSSEVGNLKDMGTFNEKAEHEVADRRITFRLPESLLDELDTEMKAYGFRTLSQYLRLVIEKRKGPSIESMDYSKGTQAAIDHLSKEIRKVGRNYNQFVRAYNASVANAREKPLSEKWTQRNLIGLMELTVEMIRDIHSLLDHFGVQHGDVRTMNVPSDNEDSSKNNDVPQRKVTIPKF